MALRPACLLLLWGLPLFIHSVTSMCNVTCSTDFDELLNCSCSASVPTHPITLDVSCSDKTSQVNGSCEIKPPQSWCVMYLDDLFTVAFMETFCTSRVRPHSDEEISDSSIWALSYVVKPWPPFNVHVSDTDGFYNITWHNNNSRHDCLTYRVRIRESQDLSKDPVHSLSVDKQSVLLGHSYLKLHHNYSVDVQAKLCPGYVNQGPWSEWSSSAEWRPAGASAETEGINRCWWYVPLAIIFVLGLLLLGFLQKPFWQKKLQLITYIPKPNYFFEPLYHNYGGNFKEWVKPVFNEYDYTKFNSSVPVMNEKHPDALHWNKQKQSYSEDGETKQDGCFLHMLQTHSDLPLPSHDGDSSQGTDHSTGHISIHTVTLSGEEFDMSHTSINILASYHDGESFGSFEEDNRAGYNLGEPNLFRLRRQSGILPQHENQISSDLSVENLNFQLHAQVHEAERVSLDSFASNGQLEDGYPHVDLDTIDSGFVECSSPGALDSNPAEQIDSDLFHEHKNSNSNYVKQWMICSTIEEDSNSESELYERC